MLPDSPLPKPAEAGRPTWVTTAPPDVPDHELLRCIGRGSYGEVWLARNVMGTYRAVKVVYRRTFEAQRPYEREFEGIRRFEPISRTHEGFIDVLHVGRSDPAGYYYYVMELADDATSVPSNQLSVISNQSHGDCSLNTYSPKTLRSELPGKDRFTVTETVQIGLALTAALEHLHQHGLVHRDIRPSNILIVNDQPKLGDVGLVAAMDQSVSFVGTQGYVPPEGPGTAQADLYSLGKVLYEIATGKDRQEFPEVPTDLEARADQGALLELNEILLKVCHREPARRYSSATELRADLLLLHSGKSITRLRRLERRLRMATRAGVVCAAIAVLAGAGYMAARRSEMAVTQQLVRLNVAHGLRLMDEGDAFGSLLRFTEALRLEQDGADREAIHRLRIGSVLRQCPKLEYMWFFPKRIAGAHPHAAFSPDGSLLALSGEDQAVQIWKINPTQPVTHALPQTSEVLWPTVNHAFYMSFSSDGSRLVTAEPGTGLARILDTSTGELVYAPLKHKAPVWDARFSPDGQVVATASGGINAEKTGEAVLWNSKTGERRFQLLESQPRVRSIDFSPDGRYVVTAGSGKSCRIFEVASGQPVTPFLDQARDASGATFSPDGQRVAIGCLRPHEAQIYNATTGELAFAPLKHDDTVFEIAFSRDGQYIATASGDRTVRVWNATNGEPVCPPFLHESPMVKVTFPSDSNQVIAAGWDGVVHVWNFKTSRRARPMLKPVGSSGFFLGPGVQFSPDKRHVATASTDGSVRLWNLATAESPHLILPHDQGIGDRPSFSPDGHVIATKSSDAIRLRELRSGQEVRKLSLETNKAGSKFISASFSFDGRRIATENSTANATNPEDAVFEARVWEVETGQAATTPLKIVQKKNTGSPFASFDGALRRVATVADWQVQVWDLATAKPIGAPLLHRTNAWGVLSPDGQRVATITLENIAQVWDAVKGQTMTPELKYPVRLNGITFSPDGKRLAGRAEDGTVPIWNAQSGQLTAVLRGHTGWITSAEFSSDGRRIATRASDGFGVGAVWDAGTGDLLAPFFKNLAHRAAFSQDGSMVFALDENRSPRVLDTTTGEPITYPFAHSIEATAGNISPDGRSLVAAYRDGKAHVWKLSTDERAVEDLVLLAQLLAAHKLGAKGALMPLEPTLLSNVWQQLRARYPDEFRLSRSAPLSE